MLKFYFHAAPNPMKVALFLEESQLLYEAIGVDILKGDQHQPDYLRINPNAKTPALVDDDVTVFDSNAILLYLSEKTGQFLPRDTPSARGGMLSWLMFVASGVGPYCGQAVHFTHYAPEPMEYAVKRYLFEARRHFGILNEQLQARRFVLGDRYTLVDMAIWGWSRAVPFILGPDAWVTLPNLKRHCDEIRERPAAQRAEALTAKFTFKTDFDESARKQLFPQTDNQS